MMTSDPRALFDMSVDAVVEMLRDTANDAFHVGMRQRNGLREGLAPVLVGIEWEEGGFMNLTLAYLVPIEQEGNLDA